MDIKEIIEQHTITSEDGTQTVDWEAVNKENNKFIGSKVGGTKSKYNQKISSLEEEIANKQNELEETKSSAGSRFQELENRINEMEQASKLEHSRNEFKIKAKEKGMSDTAIESLIKSDVNLDAFPIEAFVEDNKEDEVKLNPIHSEDSQKQVSTTDELDPIAIMDSVKNRF